MKVCLLSMKGNFDASIGQGVQRYMYYTWKTLERIQKNYGRLDKVELGIGRGLPMRKASFTLLSLLHDFSNYDIVHTPAPIMFNPLWRGNAKMITTVHELIIIDEKSPCTKSVEKDKKPNMMVRAAAGFVGTRIKKQILDSDELIVNSTQTRDEAVKLGFSKSHINIIKWGLDGRFLKGFTKPPKKFTVGYMGALNARKNIGFAIRAFKSMEGRDVQFRIYGDGPERDELERLAVSDSRIELMGFADEKMHVSVYDEFSVFVFPSVYEGLCLPILEAQARGLPVIIYKHANIPKEIRKYCFEAEDEEHMAQIIKEIKENGYDERLRMKAAQNAREYTWENAAKETVEVYRRACL